MLINIIILIALKKIKTKESVHISGLFKDVLIFSYVPLGDLGNPLLCFLF